ncbi:Type IV secretion system protein PtlE [compost metagenome]
MLTKRKSKGDVIREEREMAHSSTSPVTPEISMAIQAYTHAARHFEESVAAGEKRKARNWRRVAIFNMALAFVAVAAVLGLTPLKQVEPYLIRVDNNTGFTDIVAPLQEAPTPEKLEDELWISTYVKFRESYNFSDQKQRYDVVRLFSYDDTFAEYRNFQLSTKGYTEVLGDNQQLRITINNIVFLPDPQSPEKPKYRTAQIRYTKTPVDKKGQPIEGLEPSTWLVSLSFDYQNPAKNRQQRWINPRGFGVVAYSQAQEVKR